MEDWNRVLERIGYVMKLGNDRLAKGVELGLCVTMSYNELGTHKKRKIAHLWVLLAATSAHFVPAQARIAGKFQKP